MLYLANKGTPNNGLYNPCCNNCLQCDIIKLALTDLILYSLTLYLTHTLHHSPSISFSSFFSTILEHLRLTLGVTYYNAIWYTSYLLFNPFLSFTWCINEAALNIMILALDNRILIATFANIVLFYSMMWMYK